MSGVVVVFFFFSVKMGRTQNPFRPSMSPVSGEGVKSYGGQGMGGDLIGTDT